MDRDSRPRRRDEIVWRRGDEDIVVLDPSNGNYFSLDEVGGRVWELCNGERSAGQIAETLAKEYDAPTGEIERDVLELLEELRREGLLAASE
jgi:pyrroloquinoline quinone biosynthesis protein D